MLDDQEIKTDIGVAQGIAHLHCRIIDHADGNACTIGFITNQTEGAASLGRETHR